MVTNFEDQFDKIAIPHRHSV